jgi:hypothetical protein
LPYQASYRYAGHIGAHIDGKAPCYDKVASRGNARIVERDSRKIAQLARNRIDQMRDRLVVLDYL